MGVYKVISIATLILLSLAAADGAGVDDEILKFNAKSAIDSASDAEFEFINDIKLKANSNWNILTNAPSSDYDVFKNETSAGLNLIIDREFEMDETSKINSSRSLVSGLSYEDLYPECQLSSTIIRVELKLSEFKDFTSPLEFSSQLVIGSEFDADSDVLSLGSDISSKLGQISS